MGTWFVQLSSAWGGLMTFASSLGLCFTLLLINDGPEQSPSNMGPVVCVWERQRNTHTQCYRKVSSCGNSYRKEKKVKVWICTIIISVLSNPWPEWPYCSLAWNPIHLRCACYFWHWGDKTSRVYIWFPSSLWPMECRYLLKGEFIHVVFMPSLSGRWCSVLGKADWELLFKPKPSGGQNRTTCQEEDLWWCFPSPRMRGPPILYTTL